MAKPTEIRPRPTTIAPIMVDILKPKDSENPEASVIEDYFNVGRTNGLTLFPDHHSPIVFEEIDFYFGEDTLLGRGLLDSGGNKLRIDIFRTEFMQPLVRLMNWNGKEGEKLMQSIIDRFMNAECTAYISCHGGTYGEEGDEFWGLSTTENVAYGADRVIKALIDSRDYDLIFMTACNPDGLPLEIEQSNTKRPTIIYFNVANQWGVRDDKKPITIIEAIE